MTNISLLLTSRLQQQDSGNPCTTPLFLLTCATLANIVLAYGQPTPDLILTRAWAWSRQRFTFETETEIGGP